MKKRDTSDDNWTVYHTGLHSSEPEDYFIKLNETAAASDNHTTWNDTAPTATLFTTQNDSRNNANGAKYVFYAFKSVDGYSKVGAYSGNGNDDGAFIYQSNAVSLIDSGDNFKESNFTTNTIGAKYLFFDPYRKRQIEKPNLYSWKANNGFKWKDLIPAISVYAGANFDHLKESLINIISRLQ